VSEISATREDQRDVRPQGGEADVSLPFTPESKSPGDRAVAHLRLLWDHRGLLLRTMVLALILSTVFAFLVPVRFEATTQLMPPDSQSGSGAALLSAVAGRTGGLGGVAGDILGVKNSGALFVGVLQSRTVGDRLIDEFKLRQVYGASKMEDARLALANHTSISEDRKSGILSITVTDHDPQRAAAMAQAYVTELDRLVAQVSTSSARRERIFLEERLTAVKQDLNGAATKFSEFASKNTAIDIPEQGKAMVEAAALLQGQLISAESELRGLEAIYTEQNVRVRALRARVAELRTQLGKMGGDSGTAGALSSKSDPSLYPSIRQLPLLGVRYADLYRQTKIEETVFELLTQQYELAKVQEAKEIPSVKVLDAAIVPTKKSYPHRLTLMTVGTLLSVFAVCVYIFARRFWQAIDPQDPSKQLVEEVTSTLRFETGRLVPVGGVLSRALARMRKRPTAPAIDAQEPVKENPALPTELSRAARGGLE